MIIPHLHQMNEISYVETLHTANLGLTGTISPLIGCPTTTLVSSLTILSFCKYISDLYILLFKVLCPLTF